MNWQAALVDTAWNLAYIVAIVVPLMLSVAYLTLWERKLIGWMQIRIGPNRVGPLGLLQPIADGIKLLFKEIIVPANVSQGLLILAAVLMVMGSLNLSDIVQQQDRGMFAAQGVNFLSWNWLPLAPMLVVYFVSGIAETNRAPFDVVEGESEIVAGHMIKTSGVG